MSDVSSPDLDADRPHRDDSLHADAIAGTAPDTGTAGVQGRRLGGRSRSRSETSTMIPTAASPSSSLAAGGNPFRPSLILAIGVLAFFLPTMIDVARTSWSTDQGAHGPIVLVTGIWLLWGELKAAPLVIRPGRMPLLVALLVPVLALFIVTRISGIIEIEGFAMYGTLIVVAYGLWGAEPIKRVWFPLLYMLFVFPPPETVFAMVTQPLKIAVSQTAVKLLSLAGYPIAGSGVLIMIGQYQMLVAAACAGLNSLLSLTALGLFYTYLRHKAELPYMVVLVCFILPVAVLANLVRVLLLLLITYHFGEAAGQGFWHELAGLTMFTVALLTIFAIDWLAAPLRNRLARSGPVR